MEPDELELPELPKPTPKVEAQPEVIQPNLEEQLKELTDVLVQVRFFSDQVKFNSILYDKLSAILEKLEVIEAVLKIPRQDGKN